MTSSCPRGHEHNYFLTEMAANIVEKETQAASGADSMLATICANEHDLAALSHGNNAVMHDTFKHVQHWS